jgi:hypothetical protein
MPFPEDLLQQAYDLASREPTDPKQASLRRAVSTASYALFHLLIDEAVSKWAIQRQRSVLARTFEDGRMKGICDQVLKSAKGGGGEVPADLFTGAQNFIQIQQVARYSDAFASWLTISSQDVAQDFLLQLFLPKLHRE